MYKLMGYRTASDVAVLLMFAVALGQVQMVLPSALPSESEGSCSGLSEAGVARARSLLALHVDRGGSAGNGSSINARRNVTPPFGLDSLFSSVKKYSGNNAPLSQEGYQAVVEAGSDTEMKQFILRLCNAMYLKVLDKGVLSGLVPYYSGVREFRSFEELKAELERGTKSSSDQRPWLSKEKIVTRSDLSSFRTKARPKALLALHSNLSVSANTSSSTHSTNNNAPFGLDAFFSSSSDSEHSGKTAPLNSQGYQDVVEAESNEEMKQFIMRLAKAMHFKVLDKGVLNGFIPYYSGVEDRQSFEKLRSELKSGLNPSGNQKPWLAREKSLARLDVLQAVKKIKRGKNNTSMP